MLATIRQVHDATIDRYRRLLGRNNSTIAWAQMSEANASIPTPESVYERPMFGSFGSALASISLTFLSQAAIDAGIPKTLGLQKTV